MAGQDRPASSPSSSAAGDRRSTSSGSRGKSRRAFRTISEVAELLGLPQHVLRFWETRFPQIRPLKRSGNRRYYRPADIALLQAIRILLHEEGLTIRGVQKRFREQGVRQTVEAVLAGRSMPKRDEKLVRATREAPAAPVAPSPKAASLAPEIASEGGRVSFKPGGLARELSPDEAARVARDRLLHDTLERLRRLRALFKS